MDDDARHAARELAVRYDCSTSEAIRRAILAQRDAVLGVTPEGRQQRRRALSQLVDLFEGHDANAEVLRLKAEDKGF